MFFAGSSVGAKLCKRSRKFEQKNIFGIRNAHSKICQWLFGSHLTPPVLTRGPACRSVREYGRERPADHR